MSAYLLVGRAAAPLVHPVRRYSPPMPDCLFCRIAAGEIPAQVIAESNEAVAFMDIAPALPGHALVIPRTHVADALEATPQTLAACWDLAGRVGRAAESALGATGVSFFSFARPDGGQTIFHLHVHVVPRTAGDGLSLWPHQPGDADAVAALAERYRSAL